MYFSSVEGVAVLRLVAGVLCAVLVNAGASVIPVVLLMCAGAAECVAGVPFDVVVVVVVVVYARIV